MNEFDLLIENYFTELEASDLTAGEQVINEVVQALNLKKWWYFNEAMPRRKHGSLKTGSTVDKRRTFAKWRKRVWLFGLKANANGVYDAASEYSSKGTGIKGDPKVSSRAISLKPGLSVAQKGA